MADYRRHLGMRVSGFDAPKPVKLFVHCGFDAPLAAAIAKAGYQQPTAIQAQALPAALSGRDVLGIAKTGSGKTAAFVLPMVVHVMDQPELQVGGGWAAFGQFGSGGASCFCTHPACEQGCQFSLCTLRVFIGPCALPAFPAPQKGEGPIAVIVAPTRELAEQIHKEAREPACLPLSCLLPASTAAGCCCCCCSCQPSTCVCAALLQAGLASPTIWRCAPPLAASPRASSSKT